MPPDLGPDEPLYPLFARVMREGCVPGRGWAAWAADSTRRAAVVDSMEYPGVGSACWVGTEVG